MNETFRALVAASLVLGACGGSVDLVSPAGSSGSAGAGGASPGGRGPLGSGGAEASGGSGNSGAPSAGGSGGDASVGGAGGGAGAGAGGADVGGAGAGPVVPNVDPAVSASYRWTECGRIAATAERPRDALYAADGSILVADERGGIRLHEPGFASSHVLVNPGQSAVAMALSSDGTRLLRQHEAGVDVYVAENGGTIDAQSGPLVALSYVQLSGTTCPDAAVFSANAELIVAHGPNSVCVWDASTGLPRASINLPVMDSTRVLTAGAGTGSAPVRLLHGRMLLTYTASGEPVESFDLSAVVPTGHVPTAALTPDASTLLAVVATGTTGMTWDLVAIETETGAERWRAAVSEENFGLLTFSADGYVLLDREGVYRIEDGSTVRNDSRTFSWGNSGLSPEGRKKLTVGELVAEWDLEGGIANLYGTHTRRVVALDVSRDGRYFASHGDWAVLWELGPEFAASRPLAQGKGADSSWNIAIAPDGSGMVASGDNIALFRRDGSFVNGELPPAPAGCLSPDWSFSPSGTLLAGNRYGDGVEVRDAHDFSVARTLPATNCGGGVTFSPDGSSLITASLELFETKTWTKVWDRSGSQPGASTLGENAVEFSPDGQDIVVTRCVEGVSRPCRSDRYAIDGAYRDSLPGLQGDRARYSAEGHWAVSREHVLHLPSGTWFAYAADVTAAAFVPDGDIIAGTLDGSLVRFCRSEG